MVEAWTQSGNSIPMSDITLPIEMAELSVEEIGSIFLVMVMPNLSDETKIRFSKDEVFIKTLRSMIDEEIIILKEDGSVEVDLTWL